MRSFTVATRPRAPTDNVRCPVGATVELDAASLTPKPNSTGARKFTSGALCFHMLRLTHKRKVVRRVVLFVAVAVMHYLVAVKRTTENLFHNKSMLTHVTGLCSGWMVGTFKKYVAVRINTPPPVPSSIVRQMTSRLSTVVCSMNTAAILVSWNISKRSLTSESTWRQSLMEYSTTATATANGGFHV